MRGIIWLCELLQTAALKENEGEQDMGLRKRKTEQGKQKKDQRPKNKIIIIGEYGSGKSYQALNLMSDKNGTCIICNGSVSISTYKANFPILGDYAEKVTGNAFP